MTTVPEIMKMLEHQLEELQRNGFVRDTSESARNALVFAFGAAPHGPWNDEPDTVRFAHRNTPCALNRNRMGTWCGYVGLALGHPWFELGHEAIDAEVHGGLTFARRAGAWKIADGAPLGHEALWWLGFDCCHAWDLMPFELALDASQMFGGSMRPVVAVRADVDEAWRARGARVRGGMSHYKPVAFAREQTMRLADQVVAAGERLVS